MKAQYPAYCCSSKTLKSSDVGMLTMRQVHLFFNCIYLLPKELKVDNLEISEEISPKIVKILPNPHSGDFEVLYFRYDRNALS